MLARAVIVCLLACAPSAFAVEYELETVADGFDFPWSLAFLPGGEMLVTELPGQIRVIDRGGNVSEPLGGVPAVYRAGQGGLFDALPHPEFALNRLVYLSYAAGELRANATTVAKARLVDDALTDVQVIFATEPAKNTPMHYGGRIAWLADGTLLLTTGDGFDFREQAQDLASHLGKTVRMTATGEPAGEHPFPQSPYVWTYGHRNPQGLAVSSNGTVYLHEHGPRGGDEVNVLEAAGNYGWPAVTHGKDYNGALVSPFTEWPGMTQPTHTWVPSIAPSGLAIYEGAAFPDWRGSLFVGALVDLEVRRLELDRGRVVREEALFGELGARIRDVRAGPDGLLYVVTDGPGGAVVRVRPRR